MNDETFSVVQIYRDTSEPIKKLYTGRTREECCLVIKDLLKKRWSLNDLSIIDNSVGRHCSFVIK